VQLRSNKLLKKQQSSSDSDDESESEGFFTEIPVSNTVLHRSTFTNEEGKSFIQLISKIKI